MKDYKFKTTNIKGKEYVEVNERVLFLRNDPKYDGWSMLSEVVEHKDNAIMIMTTIYNSNGDAVATGLAREKEGDGFINKTSYVENCETSSWGRALANLGIGIEASIASSNEVSNAILQQNSKALIREADPKPNDKIMTEAVHARMINAINKGNRTAVEDSLSDYADSPLKDAIIDTLNNSK